MESEEETTLELNLKKTQFSLCLIVMFMWHRHFCDFMYAFYFLNIKHLMFGIQVSYIHTSFPDVDRPELIRVTLLPVCVEYKHIL